MKFGADADIDMAKT